MTWRHRIFGATFGHPCRYEVVRGRPVRKALVWTWVAFAALAGSGCREVCDTDELRYGDRCVRRPDAGATDSGDGSSHQEQVDGSAQSDADEGNAIDSEEAGTVETDA